MSPKIERSALRSRASSWQDLCRSIAPTALLWMLVTACAAQVRQEKLAQPMSPLSGKSFALQQDVKCTIGTGYARVLRGGTRWELFGAIDRGEVYLSPDQTLTVEGYNVHEAYIVVKDEWLVGFYLPVEKTFTPVSKSMKLIITPQ